MAESSNERELRLKIWALADKKIGGHEPEQVRKLFLTYDSNGDAMLNRGELEDLLEDAGVGNWFTRGRWVSGVFEKLDKAPADEKISWEEYVAATSAGKASTTPGSVPEPVCNWDMATCVPEEDQIPGGMPGWLLPAAIGVGMVWFLTRD